MTFQETAAEAPGKLEYPACPLCGDERRHLPFRLCKTYSVARCPGCGFHYLYPRLSESAMQLAYRQTSYYEGGACGYADTSYIEQESTLRATFRRLLHNLAKRGLAGGDLLEVGCGYGFFLDEARPYFQRRVATEFSLQAAERARATGAEVFIGGVEQIPPEARFNCVLAAHVIEHVYEPLPFVQQLVSHIKPGGHIVLATPDIGGVLSRLMGRRWPSFKAPEHVLYFDFRSLSSLMRRAGLESVRRFPYPHAFPFTLIAAKFGMVLPSSLGQIRIWVPATTVAVYGRAPRG